MRQEFAANLSHPLLRPARILQRKVPAERAIVFTAQRMIAGSKIA
jgi:hypothetical protein